MKWGFVLGLAVAGLAVGGLWLYADEVKSREVRRRIAALDQEEADAVRTLQEEE